MQRLVLIVALVVSTPIDPQAPKDATSVTAELASLDRQWQEAVVKGDTEFIEKRTGTSFTFTHGGGTRADTKADWLRIAKQVPGRFLERKTSNLSVEVHEEHSIPPRLKPGVDMTSLVN